MDPFALILLVVIGGGLSIALLSGALQQRTASRLAGQRERRDPIADGSIGEDTLERGRENENRRRRKRGKESLRKSQHDSLVVADGRTRRRLRLFGGRR